MTGRRIGAALGVAALLVAAAASLTAVAGGAETSRTVTITIRHSRFHPARVEVSPDSTVRFEVVNHDPIDHELIVGDPGVQLHHEAGTDRHHDGTHGAVSVPAGGRGFTEPAFGARGRVLLGCHLPGHWDYGMRGVVRIED
ncbi:hypothetical protein BH20ACT9_BH20ACT9_09880 [soil metagenome]